MAPLFSLDMVEKFGSGLNQAEGVVIDKDNNVYGGGRDSVLRRVSPDGTVTEIARIEGSIPNGITLDRQGNLVFCDLGKKAMMRCSLEGKVSLLADHAGNLRLNTPNFASYDARAANMTIRTSIRSSRRRQLMASLCVFVPTVGVKSWLRKSTWPTARPSRRTSRRCMCWRAHALTACASPSKKTAPSASRKFMRRTSLAFLTAWPLTCKGTCMSLSRRG